MANLKRSFLDPGMAMSKVRIYEHSQLPIVMHLMDPNMRFETTAGTKSDLVHLLCNDSLAAGLRGRGTIGSSARIKYSKVGL
jgi:hypothetical protein